MQYVELVVFQNEFQQLLVRFKENEKIIQDIPVTGSDLTEVNAHLDSLENLMEVQHYLSLEKKNKKIFEGIAIDVHKAKRLSKAGQQLMSEYSFTRDSIETKCLELRSVCKKIEIIFTQRRQSLLKFLDLFEGIEAISKVINK